MISAYEADPTLDMPALIVFGPFINRDRRRRYLERIARHPKLDALAFDTKIELLMQKAAAVVAMGGYNTFCEILSLDKPALVVPRTRPRLEQYIRAIEAARLGLVRMLDETTDRGDALARQESNLISERDELLSGSDRRQAALDALRRTATTQGILTGRLPAEGPGVIITLTEPDGAIRPLTMLDVLEELRNAGAEAIQLNGHRITASGAFTGVAGAVVLDGATLKAPFTWIRNDFAARNALGEEFAQNRILDETRNGPSNGTRSQFRMESLADKKIQSLRRNHKVIALAIKSR